MLLLSSKTITKTTWLRGGGGQAQHWGEADSEVTMGHPKVRRWRGPARPAGHPPPGPYLHVLHFHACALLAHEDIIDVHQDVAVQRQREALAREEGHGVDEDELVQPEVEVVAEQHSLNAVVEAQVLDHCGVQRRVQAGVRPQVRDGLGGARLGQQHRFVGGVVGLEHGPVLAGQHALLYLAGPRHIEQRGLGVDAAVLQAQV